MALLFGMPIILMLLLAAGSLNLYFQLDFGINPQERAADYHQVAAKYPELSKFVASGLKTIEADDGLRVSLRKVFLWMAVCNVLVAIWLMAALGRVGWASAPRV